MNAQLIRTFLVLASITFGSWILQLAVFPGTEAMLKGAKSEIRSSEIPSVLDRAETRGVVIPDAAIPRPETMPVGRAAHARAETQPTSPRSGPSAEAVATERAARVRQAVKDLVAWALPGMVVRTTECRATNTATPSDGQAAVTYEDTALNSVVGDPVNPMTGEMTYTHPVVRVPGTGLDFAFVLTYRSGYLYDGPIGNRWEHNWNARVKKSGSAWDRYARNRKDTYTQSGSAFTSPVAFFEHAVANNTSTNTFERRLQDGTLEIYTRLDNTNEPDWYFLTEVRHRDSDNTITLEYDSAEKLTKINDTRGRWFILTYDSNLRISSLEDHSNSYSTSDRTWTFEYGSGGDLIAIGQPAVGGSSGRTEFSYTGTSRLSSILAPREQATSGSPYLEMSYDGNGRVTSQKYGTSSQVYAMSYGTNVTTETDREGGRRIYSFNSAKAITSIQQETTTNTFVTTTLTWDATNALLTKVVYPGGNGQIFQYTSGHVTASIQSTASGIDATSITTMRSGTDHLVTEYTYTTGTNWQLVGKIKDPKGNEWVLERDATGNVTSYKTPLYTSDPYVMTYDSKSRVETVTDPAGRKKSFEYGTTGTLTKTKLDPDSGSAAIVTTLGRDIFENVVSITDPNGNDTLIDRNVLGYVTKVKTPELKETDYLYDKNDIVTEVHGDNGNPDTNVSAEHKVVYLYSILDIVTEVREYDGSSHRDWVYAYDLEDRLTKTTFPETTSFVQFEYDCRGLLTKRKTSVASGTTKDDVVLAYDSNGRQVTATDALSHATTTDYDQFDRVTKVTDAAGHYRTTVFDKNSNVLTMTAYASGATKLTEDTLEYDSNNRLTKRRQWAVKSNLSTDIGSGGWIDSTLTYDKAGLLITKADPCGCGGSTETIYFYDAASRLTKTKDAATNEVTLALDKNGNTTKVTQDEKESGSTKTYVVEYEYNKDRQLTKVLEKGGGSASAHSTIIDVDARGRALMVTDAQSNQVTLRRDNYGRVTRTDRGTSGSYISTATVYDLNDNVLTEKSIRPGGTDALTRYAYDRANRMTQMKDESNTQVLALVYDAADNVVSRTDGNGTLAVLTYDVRNMVTQVAYTAGSADIKGPTTEKFWYDALGRITQAYNSDSLVKRTWNSLSRLEKEEQYVGPSDDTGAGTTPRNVEYIFDTAGRPTEIKYPDSTNDADRLWVKRSYDTNGRITKIEKKVGSGGSYGPVATWVFQGPSRMKTLTFGNGVKETMEWDEYGRATRCLHERFPSGSTKSMYDFRRGYDSANRVVYERRDYYKNDGTVRGPSGAPSIPADLVYALDYGDLYRYDSANRLTKAVRGVGFWTGSHTLVESAGDTTTNFTIRHAYTLDDGGNRTTLGFDYSDGTNTATYQRDDSSYDIENQLLTKDVYEPSGGTLVKTTAKTQTFTYDTNGNQVSSTSPGAVKVDVHNRIYEFGNWRYHYDPFGRRIEKRDITSGGYWRRNYYVGVNCVSEWLTETVSGTPTEKGAYWLRVFGPYLVDQPLWANYDSCADQTSPNDLCAGMSGYFHLDFIGTCVMVTADSSDPAINQVILEQYRYDEYGEVTFCTGDGAPASPNVSAGDQTYLFTSREWDGESSSYYYRARTYAPSQGRFNARDPIAAHEVSSGYAYVDLAPMGAIDPFGLEKETQDAGTETRPTTRPGAVPPGPPAPDDDPFVAVGPTFTMYVYVGDDQPLRATAKLPLPPLPPPPPSPPYQEFVRNAAIDGARYLEVVEFLLQRLIPLRFRGRPTVPPRNPGITPPRPGPTPGPGSGPTPGPGSGGGSATGGGGASPNGPGGGLNPGPTGPVSATKHILDQLTKRGWTMDKIRKTVQFAKRIVKGHRDTRKRDDGGRNDDPATLYEAEDGGYVIVNDRTGDVVQISDRNRPDWKGPK